MAPHYMDRQQNNLEMLDDSFEDDENLKTTPQEGWFVESTHVSSHQYYNRHHNQKPQTQSQSQSQTHSGSFGIQRLGQSTTLSSPSINTKTAARLQEPIVSDLLDDDDDDNEDSYEQIKRFGMKTTSRGEDAERETNVRWGIESKGVDSNTMTTLRSQMNSQTEGNNYSKKSSMNITFDTMTTKHTEIEAFIDGDDEDKVETENSLPTSVGGYADRRFPPYSFYVHA